MNKVHSASVKLLSLATCAAVAITPIACFNNTANASGAGPANCDATVFKNLGIIESESQYTEVMDKLRNQGEPKISLGAMQDAFNSAKQLPKYSVYASVFKYYTDNYENFSSTSEAEQANIVSTYKRKIAATGVTVNYDISYPSGYDYYGELYKAQYAWFQADTEAGLYSDIYNFNEFAQNSEFNSLEMYRRDYFLTAICTASLIDPGFKVSYVNSSDPFAKKDSGSSNAGDTDSRPSTGSSSSSTSSSSNSNSNFLDQVMSQLRELIEQIKNDLTFIHYQELIEAVKSAEELLETLDVSANAAPVSRQMPDQPYVANAIIAKQASMKTTPNDTQDIVDIIKNIGEAMRELGIKTDLGQGENTYAVADLKQAIQAAKNTAKYDEYVQLSQILEKAELALKNNTADSGTLAKLSDAYGNFVYATADVQIVAAPDTGVANPSGTTSTLAQHVILISTTLGVVVAVIEEFIKKTKRAQIGE